MCPVSTNDTYTSNKPEASQFLLQTVPPPKLRTTRLDRWTAAKRVVAAVGFGVRSRTGAEPAPLRQHMPDPMEKLRLEMEETILDIHMLGRGFGLPHMSS